MEASPSLERKKRDCKICMVGFRSRLERGASLPCLGTSWVLVREMLTGQSRRVPFEEEQAAQSSRGDQLGS